MAEGETPEGTPCAEHCPLLGLSRWMRDLKAELKELLPEEFWEHRRAARRETLLALRSLLDAAIETTEKGEGSTKKRGRIEIS
jgi:hypothetical protein